MIKLLTALMGATLFLLSTPAFAQMPNPCGPGEDDEACFTRLKVLIPGLMQTSDELQGRVNDLEREQASAIGSGDVSEIARLRRELQTVTAERDAALEALEIATTTIARLEGELETLSGRVDELEALVTQFLEAESTQPVVEAEPESAPASRPQPSPQLALYQQPQLDPSIYGRMGWRDGNPQIPSPVVHPDVRWRDGGNCLTVYNERSRQHADPFVFVDVRNIDVGIDPSGYTMGDEVLLGPGQDYSFCTQGGSKPRVTYTPARTSTASSSERQWDGRQWVSVERAPYSCTTTESFGADRAYEFSGAYCGAGW